MTYTFLFPCSTSRSPSSLFFFFNDTATTEIYTLSLHDALPIFPIGFLAVSIVYEGLYSLPYVRRWASRTAREAHQIGRAHVSTPITSAPHMPSSSCKKNNEN